MTLRYWTSNEIERLKEIYPITENKEIAKVLGRTASSVTGKAHSLQLKKDQDYFSRKHMESKIYALYQGEEHLITGTLEEIASNQGTTIMRLKYMSYPSYH